MKYKPTYMFNNIFDISINFYKENNIKYVLFDLDNTLDSPFENKISQKTKDYLIYLFSNNIEPIIISNNSKKRVSLYIDDLKIKYLYRAIKPFTHNINKFLTINKINKDECIMVGDQIFTDIKCSKRLKINSILVNPLIDKDKLITLFNRTLDKWYRKKLLK